MITDNGLEKLSSLQQLQSINLVGTKITADGLKALKKLKQLQSIYIYQTKIKKEDLAQLQKDFPKVLIDSGGYNVPFFPDDTVVLKAPVYK